MKTGNKVYNRVFTAIAVVIVCLSAGFQSTAQDLPGSFTIQVDKSLAPLAEGWINEYSKSNPGASIHLSDQINASSSPEIRLFEHIPGELPLSSNEAKVHVGQVAILPFIHEMNPLFTKELKRGVKQNQLKGIFFSDESDWLENSKNPQAPEPKIYSPVPQSSAAEAFAGFLGKPSADLKGIYVSGSDTHLLSALLLDPLGISYSRLSLIFDPVTRLPVEGIKILPVDLNNNGRLDKNELIYDNLDLVILYAENTRKPSIPTLQISLGIKTESLSNPDIDRFINWVKTDGQKVNFQLGFNTNREINPDELTNK